MTVSIPGGAERAARTFNPSLGVEGGLSILGTSGIVEPMSEQAIVDTIALQTRQAAAVSTDLILTPGSYGEDFLKGTGLDRLGVPVVKYSNFLGDALDLAVSEGFRQVLLVGHHGSKYATSRDLLETVRPEVGVISVGAGNRYGHPAPEVLERLAAAGCEIYRTDWSGTLTFTVRDGG